jgi:hypothetical protein
MDIEFTQCKNAAASLSTHVHPTLDALQLGCKTILSLASGIEGGVLDRNWTRGSCLTTWHGLDVCMSR